MVVFPIEADVDVLLVGPPHQDVATVHVTVLKLQGLHRSKKVVAGGGGGVRRQGKGGKYE